MIYKLTSNNNRNFYLARIPNEIPAYVVFLGTVIVFAGFLFV
jgi:hypothetical protein